MVGPRGRAVRLWVVVLSAGYLSLSTVSFGGADTVFLKQRPEGNRGVVVEETDEHILIRFPRSEIQRIRRDGDAFGPRTNAEGWRGSATSPDKERQVRSPEGPVGAVEGRILYRGRGLAGCSVKLIRHLESTTFLGMFKEAKEGAEFETVTDEDGLYRFEEVPPGKYLLRWRPRGSDSWIRTLSERQYDLIVEKGETATPRDIDTSKPVLER